MIMENKALSKTDPTSWSNPDEVIIEHIHMAWDVNFDRKIIQGSVLLQCRKVVQNAECLDLDVKDLTFSEIKDNDTHTNLTFEIGQDIKKFGSRLRIRIPTDHCVPSINVLIKYSTLEKATALQWLTPQQTTGKVYPYLFSQCQPIHARSLLPCQDTPSTKFTFTSEVTVPQKLTALMSALRVDEEIVEDKMKFQFRQPKPIPSYLIAIAVGKLVSKTIGPRSMIWSDEIEILETAAKEFRRAEEFLSAAEQICGPYEWGIFDILVLPPSFPFGGMENPCVTFVTPTILAGDESLVDVIAHEITHSWTGNLVTNKTFEHFWLNEGFTVFIERKILGNIYGQKTRHFSALNGLSDLQFCVESLDPLHKFTKLVVQLEGVDPDDAFSTCPYEKGHTFLYYLENILGGEDVFNGFIKAYVENFKFKSLTTENFRTFLYDYFRESIDILQSVNWDLWLNSPGMPPIIPVYDSTLQKAVDALVKQWVNWNPDEEHEFCMEEFKNLSPSQIESFFNCLLKEEQFPVTKLKKMQELYRIEETGNCEIKFRWLWLCISNRYEEQMKPTFDFVNKYGRMKYVRPLYRELYSWNEKREDVINNYIINRDSMMHMTAHALSHDLKLDK